MSDDQFETIEPEHIDAIHIYTTSRQMHLGSPTTEKPWIKRALIFLGIIALLLIAVGG